MPTPVSGPNEARITIPEGLLQVFAQQPRIVIKWRPDGLWPVDPGLLVKVDWKKLAADREFIQNFEVVIMPKVKG